ncbi:MULTISPECIES: hypothetical protein, partial [unclassified Microcoleus]
SRQSFLDWRDAHPTITIKIIQHIPCVCRSQETGFLATESEPEARTVKKPGFWSVLHKPPNTL